jgi:hypothetical protein
VVPESEAVREAEWKKLTDCEEETDSERLTENDCDRISDVDTELDSEVVRGESVGFFVAVLPAVRVPSDSLRVRELEMSTVKVEVLLRWVENVPVTVSDGSSLRDSENVVEKEAV